jgi:hypothetical protein
MRVAAVQNENGREERVNEGVEGAFYTPSPRI